MGTLSLIAKLIRYNLKIIFGNKFIYFLLGSTAIYLFFVTVNIFEDSSPSASTVFDITLFPAVLLIFYPTVFGIQNDEDARILEILFGIPNYRYKVWLVRLVMIFVLTFPIILLFGFIGNLAVYPINFLQLGFHIMFPVIFIGSTAFMFSTIIRNGNGTAVVMIIVGIGFMISSGILDYSSWNIFLNPFNTPFEEMNEVVWERTVFYNRIYLLIGSALAIMTGLINMQKREKFV